MKIRIVEIQPPPNFHEISPARHPRAGPCIEFLLVSGLEDLTHPQLTYTTAFSLRQTAAPESSDRLRPSVHSRLKIATAFASGSESGSASVSQSRSRECRSRYRPRLRFRYRFRSRQRTGRTSAHHPVRLFTRNSRRAFSTEKALGNRKPVRSFKCGFHGIEVKVPQ